MTEGQVLQAVARAWCHRETASKEMDAVLATAITKEILKLPCNPNLGCATTFELLNEISARIETSNKDLTYRTIE